MAGEPSVIFMKLNKRSKTRIAISVGVFIIAIFPFKLTIAPERHLRVIDKFEKPVIASVEQNWHQYALNKHGTAVFRTDGEGKISLPKREVTASIAYLIFGAIKEISKVGLETGFTSTESIGIFAKGFPDTWFYNGEGLLSNKIILGEMGITVNRPKK